MSLQDSVSDPHPQHRSAPPELEPDHAPAGELHWKSVTTWLIAICVAVYVTDIILGHMGFRYWLITRHGRYPRLPDYFTILEAWGYFSPDLAIFRGEVWRFITFQFLHGSVLHLAFNMLSLFFFGPMIEEYLGRKRFLAFYLVCGVGGAVCYLLLWMLGILVSFSWLPLIGASAGIFGILMAAAILAPDATVVPVFPPIPMRLKMVAWVLLGGAVWTIMTQGRNAGGRGGASWRRGRRIRADRAAVAAVVSGPSPRFAAAHRAAMNDTHTHTRGSVSRGETRSRTHTHLSQFPAHENASRDSRFRC